MLKPKQDVFIRLDVLMHMVSSLLYNKTLSRQTAVSNSYKLPDHDCVFACR